jgi:hypothetical protein
MKHTVTDNQTGTVLQTGLTYSQEVVITPVDTDTITKGDLPQSTTNYHNTPYSDTFLYIPKGIDLKQLILDKGRKERFFFHYAYIISTIYLGRFKNKKLTKDSFVNLNTDTLREVISQRKCKEIIGDLITWDIIECDYKRKVGSKSYGYRFPTNSPSYSDTFYRVKIEDKLIIKKMNNFKEKQRLEARAAGADYEHLFNYIHKIKINQSAAMKYINDNYTPYSDEYEARRLSVELIIGGDIFFIVDSKGNRAHTNLTNLASDLRQFITFEGRKLGQVDLKNSQPFLLNLILKKRINMRNEKEYAEYAKYKKLTEDGIFYEYLMEAFGIDNSNDKARKDFKLLFFGRVFFDVNRKKLKKEEELFKNLFPTIFRIIREVKQEDYTQLAISLQKVESKAVITECVRRIRIEEPDMFVSTIHDSIVGELHNLDYFREVLEDVFALNYNLNPGIKTEKF